jgi:hypothetical protein
VTTRASIEQVTQRMVNRLRDHLDRDALSGVEVTAVAPDQVRVGGALRLNVFLYMTAPSAALRNAVIDWLPSSTHYPPVAVDLQYLCPSTAPTATTCGPMACSGRR